MTPEQLKGRIKNIALKSKVSPQQLLQNYCLERLMKRLTCSPWKENLIIKGGFLVSHLTGLASRTTMDIDATVRSMELTQANAEKIFADVTRMPDDDGMNFVVEDISRIRENDTYECFRVKLLAIFSPLRIPLKVDLTVGDPIFPEETGLRIVPMLDDDEFTVQAYPLETLLAEKLETVLRLGEFNTRAKDFYDLFILNKLFTDKIRPENLRQAFHLTLRHRKQLPLLKSWEAILQDTVSSPAIQTHWKNYQRTFAYAADIEFSSVVDAIRQLLIIAG